MSAVLVENLSKIYTGGNKAVDGISFRLEQGEIFGFLGPNGAGNLHYIRLMNTGSLFAIGNIEKLRSMKCVPQS